LRLDDSLIEKHRVMPSWESMTSVEFFPVRKLSACVATLRTASVCVFPPDVL
jgi:hypothetical protein